MKTFVQLVDNKAHWIFQEKERPPYPEDVVIVDITGQDVQEGDLYDPETGVFTKPVYEPVEPEPQIEQQILFETQYQTLLLEIMSSGGMI